jgi:hypothetical protein
LFKIAEGTEAHNLIDQTKLLFSLYEQSTVR